MSLEKQSILLLAIIKHILVPYKNTPKISSKKQLPSAQVPKEIKSLLTALGPAVPFPCQFSPCIRIGKTQFSRSRAKSKTANRRLPKTMIHQTI